VAALAGAGLGGGLVSRGERTVSQPVSRPVTAAEAGLLAGMRARDYQDGYASFRAVVGSPSEAVRITGRLDWRRPMVYFTSLGATPGPADGLVEAVPRLVAVRAGRPTAHDAASAGGSASATGAHPSPSADDSDTGPPAVPPDDGWRIRGLAPEGPSASAFDILINLLFALASPQADPVQPAAHGVRQDTVDGARVAVLDAPPPPTSKTSEVRYWLDGTGGLRRLEALLAENLPVRVDIQRADPAGGTASAGSTAAAGGPATAAVPVIDLLGGAPVAPRPITSAEAELLARLPARDRSSGGGRLTVQLPVQPASLIDGQGWLDWRAGRASLAAGNPDDDTQRSRLWADGYRVSMRGRTGGWRTTTWSNRPASDLDTLLRSALAATSARFGLTNPAGLTDPAGATSFLRRDDLHGVPVTVFEIRLPGENARPGQGRLRYWVDRTGLLLRVELRTALGAFAHLDITPATVPALPRPG
jgi:hypothetical protein